MTQEALLEACGVGRAPLPNLVIRVLRDSGQEIDSGREILAMSAGPAAHRIRLLVGDRVPDEMTRYDESEGAYQFSAQGRTCARIAPAGAWGGAQRAPMKPR